MRYLKQNTATIVTIGPFIDKTDGVTLKDAIAEGASELITFIVDSNDGSAPTKVLDMVATNASTDNDVTDLGTSGYYGMELTAANTNYVGRAVLSITNAAVHCPVIHEFEILPANVYDSLMGTDLLDVNTAQWLGTAAHAATENGTPCVEVVRWGGNDIAATGINGTPKVDVSGYNGTAAHAATTAGIIPVDVHQWLGTDAHAATVNGVPVVQLHNSAGTGGINAPANFEDLSITDTTGLVAVPDTQKVDVNTIKTQAITCAAGVTVSPYVGNATAALSVSAAGRVDVGLWLGTACATPSVAGVPEVDLTHINGTAASGSATVDANVVTIDSETVSAAGTVTFNANVGAAAAPGAANGMFIAGTNAPVTITGSGDALTLTSTGANGNAMKLTSHGAGHGITFVVGGLTSYAIFTGNAANGIQDISNLITNYVADILADTSVIGTAGAGLTAVPWNAAWDAEVQSECDEAITANTLVNRIMPALAGTVTGAGTGTEVFIYGGVTMTVTVDVNGNRSVVAWS
jgi:hypothetical protein